LRFRQRLLTAVSCHWYLAAMASSRRQLRSRHEQEHDCWTASASDDQQLVATASVYFHALHAAAPKWACAEPSGGVPAALRPMPLEAAVDALARAPWSAERRLASATLARACALSRGAPHGFRLRAALRTLAGFELGGDVLRASAERAYDFAYGLLGGPGRCRGCTVRTDPWRFEYDSQLSIASAWAGAETNRPLADFRGAGDPRSWELVAPRIFELSRELAEPPRTLSSLAQVRTDRTSFPLFERAKWPIGEHAFSRYQNVLGIRYRGEPTIELEYDLYESCTTSMPPIYDGAGGLSVDSGYASIRRSLSGTRLEAHKRLRHVFPNGDPIAFYINWLAVPYLVYLMESFVVVGACADGLDGDTDRASSAMEGRPQLQRPRAGDDWLATTSQLLSSLRSTLAAPAGRVGASCLLIDPQSETAGPVPIAHGHANEGDAVHSTDLVHERLAHAIDHRHVIARWSAGELNVSLVDLLRAPQPLPLGDYAGELRRGDGRAVAALRVRVVASVADVRSSGN
jgi:hypothetical protein